MSKHSGGARVQREQLVLAMLAGSQSVTALCRRFHCSRQSAYKYRRRYLRHGPDGLQDARAYARRGISVVARRWRTRVLALRRRRPSWGARKLRWWLRQRWPRTVLPGERTIQRWLAQVGVVRRFGRRHRVRIPRLRAAVRALRPNDVWTIDWKGWFRTGDGRRCEPLTVRDLASRFLLATTPVRDRSEASVQRRCLQLFRRYGRPRAVRVDRGAPFAGVGALGLTRLSLWWHRLGVQVQFVCRRQRRDNNAHEQMHRVLKRETANPPAANGSAQLSRLRRWRRFYNTRRPHEALGLQPPARFYRRSTRRLPRLRTPRYPAHWTVRLVRHGGEIQWRGHRYHIGRAFAGLPVGLQPHAHGFRVFCDRLLLGTLEPHRDRSLIPRPTPSSSTVEGGGRAPSLRPSPSKEDG